MNKKTKKEVKLAKKETIMADFQKERTNAISEMFDNENEDGIFPTSQFFIRLDNALTKALQDSRKQIVAEINKNIAKEKPNETYESCLARGMWNSALFLSQKIIKKVR